MIIRSLPAILVTAFAFTVPLSAQETVVATPSVVKVLPKETSLLIHAPNVTSLLSKIEASPLYKLKNKPEIAGLVTAFKEGIEGLRQEAKTQADVDPVELLESVKGEVCIAFGNMGPLISVLGESLMNMEEPELSGEMIPLMISVDTGSGRPAFKKNLLALMAFAARNGVGVKTDKFQTGKITKLTPPEGEADGPEALYVGELGTKYFLSVSKKFLQQTMTNLAKGAGQNTLESTSEFRATAQAMGKDSDLRVFVNVKPILKAVDQAMSANPFVFVWQTVSETLFGKSMNNIGMSYSLQKDSLKSAFFIHNGGAADGILGWFKSKPFSPTPPSIVPDDSLVYSTTGLNGEAIGNSIKKILELVQSFAALQGEVIDIEQIFEQNVGVKFTAFLKSIGNRLHYFTSAPPSLDNPAGDMTVILELRDDGVWKTLLNKALELTGGALQPKRYMGREVFTAGLDAAELGGMDPALSVTDKMLIFGLSSQSVEKVIRRIGKDVPGIGDNPAFKKLVANVPAQVTGISLAKKEYTDASMELLEESLGALPLALGVELPDGLMELLTAMGTTMGDAVSYATWTESGYYAESVAPYRK